MSNDTIGKKSFYDFALRLIKPICALFYPTKVIGLENIPDGAAIICANHSNYIDPVLIGIAAGKKHMIHFMAKAELFENRLFGGLLRKLGTFPVHRGTSDIDSVRTSMKLLRGGEKIMMFPEGTRVAQDDAVAAKSGAVRLATKLDVPIVPVHLPRGKKVFRKVLVVIGEPYKVTAENGKYDVAASELMERIKELRGSAV